MLNIQEPLPSDTSSHVLIIQHNDACPPAYLELFLKKRSIPFFILHISYPEFPQIDASLSWRAVVSLGGPQGAYEDDIYPYLKWEKSFLMSHYQSRTPSLGICLGSQLLADAVGGKAYKGPVFEVGFPELTVTKEGLQDDTVKALLATNPVQPGEPTTTDAVPLRRAFVNHHGDTFRLPDEATILLKSSLYTQCYKIGNVFAVQFHPEAGESELSQWIKGDSDERLAAAGQDRQGVLAEIRARQPESLEAAEIFFNAWWQTVENHAQNSVTSF